MEGFGNFSKKKKILHKLLKTNGTAGTIKRNRAELSAIIILIFDVNFVFAQTITRYETNHAQLKVPMK